MMNTKKESEELKLNEKLVKKVPSRSFFARYKMLGVFTIIALACPLFIRSQYTFHMLIMMLLYAFLSSAWNILGGFCGHFSLGNGVYLAFGGYITGALFTTNGISPWIGILIAAFLTGAVSIVLSYPCFKLRGSYYCLSTIALLVVFKIIVTSKEVFFGYNTGGSMGLRLSWVGGAANMQFEDKMYYYYIIAVLLILAIWLSIYLKNSKSGSYFSAITTNQEAAESLGVNTTAYKLKAQFISAFLTAIGGGFYVMFIMYLDPNRVLGYSFSIEIMVYAVIGGIGTIWGPILGALVLYPINEVLRTALGTSFAGLSTALYGLLLMAVVFYMPSGILPLVTKKLSAHVHRSNRGNIPPSMEKGA